MHWEKGFAGSEEDLGDVIRFQGPFRRDLLDGTIASSSR